MVSSVLNIQDLAKGISNKTYKTSRPSKMNYGDLKKIWIIFMQNRRKRLTTVFFINVPSDIKRCIQFTVKIKMKTFNRIPTSCFRVSAECSVSYIIQAILNALGDGDLRKTSIKETSQLMSVLVNDIFNILQNEPSQVHIT